MKHTLKEIVDGTTAVLSHVCEGKINYEIRVPNKSDDPLACTITHAPKDSVYCLIIDTTVEEWKATYLMPEMKTIHLMRWIRKGIKKEDNTFFQIL